MDDHYMRQRVSQILDWFEWQERERWARRIVISSAAAAGLTLGLAGCPEIAGSAHLDGGQPIATQPMIDPDITAEYAVQPPPLPLGVAHPALPPDSQPAVVSMYSADTPRPPVTSKYGVRPNHRPPKDLLELEMPRSQPSKRP